jgi:hypothetical protein
MSLIAIITMHLYNINTLIINYIFKELPIFQRYTVMLICMWYEQYLFILPTVLYLYMYQLQWNIFKYSKNKGTFNRKEQWN